MNMLVLPAVASATHVNLSAIELDFTVLSRSVLEFVWRGLRLDKDIGSGSEVNRLVSELLV